MGKQSAHTLVYDITMQAQTTGLNFKQALLDSAEIGMLLSNDELEALFDLEQSTMFCTQMAEQVIARTLLIGSS